MSPTILFSGLPGAEEEALLAEDLLAGTWSVRSLVIDGEECRDAAGDRLTFRRGKLTRLTKKGELTGSYRYVPGKGLAGLDLVPDSGAIRGLTYQCVYEKRDAELKLCYALSPSTERPAEINSRQGSGTALMALCREPA